MRSPSEKRFWQLLLGAELPNSKLARISSEIQAQSNETDAIRVLAGYPSLTEAESKRIQRAERWVPSADGPFVLTAEQLPPRVQDAMPGVRAVWALGDVETLTHARVAIVGTRGATAYGKACAIKFAAHLTEAGATIVSGGAFGIDAAAHRGAIDAGGSTIAVMPSGVDVAYPASHRQLFADIRHKGLQISQFCCGMQPRHDTFLSRNMLIAAISDAVVIIEAPEASGALHTANRAADMGRPVYVVPASITHISFKGSHSLIRSGATLVDHPDQILEDLQIMGLAPKKEPAAINSAQSGLLGLLSSEPISAEKLADSARLDPADALSELTMLELQGLVIRTIGGFVLAP